MSKIPFHYGQPRLENDRVLLEIFDVCDHTSKTKLLLKPDF